MAGGQERILRRRIKSVEQTKKITKAMELISASRIAKAQARVAAARPYSQQITEVITNLAGAGAATSHPLLTMPETVQTTGYVVITSDRGLCGAYNTNVIRATERSIRREQAAGRDYLLVTCGKKAAAYFKFRGFKIHQAFEGMSDKPTYADAQRVAEAVAAPFAEGLVQRVELAYTEFLSVGNQRVSIKRFMPLDTTAVDAAAATGPSADYEFEPGPTEILGALLPRYVEARLFAAMLDAAASEHAARQRAMKAATDNAEDLITNLRRVMNRARQDSITTEIMEVVGGAEALRSGGGKTDLLPDLLVNADFLSDSRPR